MLTDDHKKNRMSFLESYHQVDDAFLDLIVTGDETWLCHFIPEGKQQSMDWRHPQSPKRPKIVKQMCHYETS